MTSRAAIVCSAVAVVLVAGLGGCGDGDSSDAADRTEDASVGSPEEQLQEHLEGLPGVASASVESEAWEEDQYDTTAEVTMTAAATTEQYGDALAELEASQGEFQTFYGSVAVAGSTEDDWSGLRSSHDPVADTDERAEWLVHTLEVLPDAAVEVEDGIRLTVEAIADIEPAARTVLDDDLIGGIARISVGTADGGNYPAGHHLSTSVGLDADLVDTWNRSLAATTSTPDGVRTYALYVVRHEVDPDTASYAELEVIAHLRIKGAGAEVRLTDHGDLWPTVQALLDIVDRPDLSGELIVTSSSNPFLDINTGSEQTSYVDRRDWHDAAADYLAERRG